jgi:putative ABC transport system permease protein
MFRNYLKTSLADLRKNLIFSTVNIFGLAISLTACMFIIVYLSFELSYDAFHVDANRIFRLQMNLSSGEIYDQNASTYPILKNIIIERIPEITDVVRLRQKKGIVSLEENSKFTFTEEKIFYADDSFFQMFSFRLLQGNPKSALSHPNTVVLTEAMVRKYFGADTDYKDVIGKALRKIGSTENELLTITGVCENTPPNSHFSFDFIVSYKSIYGWADQDGGDYKQLAEYSTEWPGFYTYVLVDIGTRDIQFLQSKISKAFSSAIPDYQKGTRYDFILQPLLSIHLESNLNFELENNANKRNIIILGLVAMILWVITVLNYVNLSSSKSSDHHKGVGIHKVLGASKLQISARFLTESLVVSLISSTVALAMFTCLWSIFRSDIGFKFDYELWSEPTIYVFFVVAIIMTTLAYSSYPISLLSSNNPFVALKGVGSKKSGTSFRKTLVAFQVLVSSVLIVGSIVTYKQFVFMSEADLKIKIQDVLILRAPKLPTAREDYLSKSATFKTELMQLAGVEAATRGAKIPGEELATHTVQRADISDGGKLMNILGVDQDYFKTFQLPIVAGTHFLGMQIEDAELSSYNEGRVNFGSNDHSIIINESAAKLLGYADPQDAISQQLFLFGTKKKIVGVASDYHHQSLKKSIQPTVFYIQLVYANYYIIDVDPVMSKSSLIDRISKVWHQVYPADPFEYFFLSDFYSRQYDSDKYFEIVLLAFTLLLIIIACLGVFALSLFIISKRTKEIAIRKINGASKRDLLKVMFEEFFWPMGISVVLSIPISYIIFSEWLNTFPYRVSVSIPIYLIAIGIISLITTSIVTSHILIAANKNLARHLRSD